MTGRTYTLYNYFDVWNYDGEWVVNNQCIEAEDIYISDDSTDKEICTYLKDAGYLTTNDMRRLYVDDEGDAITIYERKGLKPIYGLLANS